MTATTTSTAVRPGRPSTLARLRAGFAARRTAVLSGAFAIAAAVSEARVDGLSGPEVITSLGVGVVAYLVAYQVEGLTAKLLLGAGVKALGAVATGWAGGQDPWDVGLAAVIAVGIALGFEAGLPSTSGSIAKEAARNTTGPADDDLPPPPEARAAAADTAVPVEAPRNDVDLAGGSRYGSDRS